MLKLDKNTDNVQVKRILDYYEKAVNSFNKNNFGQRTTLLRDLKEKCVDKDVNKIIEIAKTDETTTSTVHLLKSDKNSIS